MAKFSKGILGSFSGTVGTVIGSSWMGKPVMRSLPGPRKSQPSDGQLTQQAKFALATEFVHSFNGLMSFSFKPKGEQITGPNLACRLALVNAIAGNYPDLAIDYSKTVVSSGTLANVEEVTATAGAGGQVNFTWTDNSGDAAALKTDMAVLVVYSPDKKRGLYKAAAAVRTAGAATIDVKSLAGLTVHTWISFMTADGKKVATSLYTGEVVVPSADQQTAKVVRKR